MHIHTVSIANVRGEKGVRVRMRNCLMGGCHSFILSLINSLQCGDVSSNASVSTGVHFEGLGNGTHGCEYSPIHDTGDMVMLLIIVLYTLLLWEVL
jgi:hypothetical protein